ncbi:MAG: hypothetical protein TREMPRED_001626 [Tremellales sp. Tagirdzhanova-0007]|nr:MAG: hypothetical protein TREMPRED_001626 [Tremellales sp. Tagirdzhanova-0007]
MVTTTSSLVINALIQAVLQTRTYVVDCLNYQVDSVANFSHTSIIINPFKLKTQHILLFIMVVHLLAGLICLLHLNSDQAFEATFPVLPHSPPERRVTSYQKATVIPPHIFLLHYLHPAASLWPQAYLRAFDETEKGGGMLKLDRTLVLRDLREGKVFLRRGVTGKYDAIQRWNWEGVQWIEKDSASGAVIT